VAPPLARKISGFAPGEEPPAGWVNWLWNLGYKWNEYLRDVLDETAVALGGTNATDLPTLLARGAFTPTFDDSTDITYTTQIGEYWREGQVVHVNFHVVYEYTGTGREGDPVQILPPFSADLATVTDLYVGVLDEVFSD